MVNSFNLKSKLKSKLTPEFHSVVQGLSLIYVSFTSVSSNSYENSNLIDKLQESIRNVDLPLIFSTINNILNKVGSTNTQETRQYFNNFQSNLYARLDIDELKYVFENEKESALYEMRSTYRLAIKDYQGAAQDIEYLISLSSQPTAYLYRQAAQCYTYFNIQKASEYYDKAVELKTDIYFTYEDRKRFYIKIGDYQKALQDCISIINMGVAHAGKYRDIGDLYLKLGNKEKAIESYKKALDINQQDIEKISAKNSKSPFDQVDQELHQELLGKIESIQNSISQKNSYSQPNSSSDCFVVTATFGTPYAQEVIKYRHFRDKYLSQYLLGRIFIDLYSFWGPKLAAIVKKNPRLKLAMAKVLGAASQMLPEVKDYKLK